LYLPEPLDENNSFRQYRFPGKLIFTHQPITAMLRSQISPPARIEIQLTGKKSIADIILLTILTVMVSACGNRNEFSSYLGEMPPGEEPVIFELPVQRKSFAAERIEISNDNKTIWYQELDGYPELDGKPHSQRIKYFSYSAGKWHGPFVLFEGWSAPALSVTNDTMFIQKGGSKYEAYISVRSHGRWSNPKRILQNLNRAHYLQVTGKGSLYAASVSEKRTGYIDRCILKSDGHDTTAVSLGSPLNYKGYNLDFFISRDELFMILPDTSRELCISLHKQDGSWTYPRSFGKKICFGLAAWGPYVSNDNKYLFYTTGTKEDYSDTHIYWVRIDHLMDSLKKIR
jgi:hypothetical protein